jgi:chaperonin GroEL
MPKPGVLHNPEAGTSLKRGFDTLADLLALTLGPSQGIILSEPQTGSTPEVLTDAATIARRLMQLPQRTEDVGAMLLRNLVWRMHQRVGDGCATTAVLAQAILQEAHRYQAAGANPMLLRTGLDRAARAALDALRELARPVTGEDELIAIAETITGEPELSLLLGEIFDLLGPDGHVSIEEYVAPYFEREYKEGGRFQGRLASPYLITDPPSRRAIQTGCQVALYGGDVTSLEDLQPLLELVARGENKGLALLAHDIKGTALSTLAANHQRGHLKVVAAALRRPESKRRTDFQDLAVLTGATYLSPELGASLRQIKAADLGTAQRVEASADEVIVVGQPAHAAAVRTQIDELRGRLQTVVEGAEEEEEEAEELRFRLARLSGQVATLKIGAATKTEREVMLQMARKGLRALPVALREGVVPGGGVAYLACLPAVRTARNGLAGEAAWGAGILERALQEPFLRIAQNAGASSPAAVLDRAQRRGPEFGLDAVSGLIVDMGAAGILDAAGVLREALQTAVSGATMAFTTDAIVHKRRPKESLEP